MVRFERNVLARVTPATARSDGARAWSAASARRTQRAMLVCARRQVEVLRLENAVMRETIDVLKAIDEQERTRSSTRLNGGLSPGLLYVTSNEWSTRRYLDMSRLGETVREAN